MPFLPRTREAEVPLMNRLAVLPLILSTLILAGSAVGAADKPAPPALYVHPSDFRAVDVSVGTAPFVLGGTLTVPVGLGPFPGVVLLHGSGPQDRDETIGASKVFKDLAEGLASRGIEVLRYDKR